MTSQDTKVRQLEIVREFLQVGVGECGRCESCARTARDLAAHGSLDEAIDAFQTIASLAALLGWTEDPPPRATLERSVKLLKSRVNAGALPELVALGQWIRYNHVADPTIEVGKISARVMERIAELTARAGDGVQLLRLDLQPALAGALRAGLRRLVGDEAWRIDVGPDQVDNCRALLEHLEEIWRAA